MPPLSQIIFKKYDIDGSGFLSVDELYNLCYDMGHHMTREKLALAIKMLDDNGDGKFSYDEFRKWWSDENRFEMLESIDGDWMKRAIDHFQYFDKDRSGNISRDEMLPLYENLKKAGHRIPSMDHFMANVDTDRSGSVSLREYIDWLKTEV